MQPAMYALTPVSRRQLMLSAIAGSAALALAKPMRQPEAPKPLFEISLAEWSLHRALFAKEMTNLDFPAKAKEFGIDAVEYVNSFFKDKAKDSEYLGELNKRCADLGVKNVLIMCDGEGDLGDPDDAARTKAVENHYRWVDAAKVLGCHSIRVNARSKGTWDEQKRLAADGLHRLCEYGAKSEINVIVENHGGLSSNGEWLAATIKAADHPRCGTLPDFGNFSVGKNTEGSPEVYDRYKGVELMMPTAKGVSAKSHEFDSEGNETGTDYRRMLKIVLAAGYHGRIGVEYEGSKHSEAEGITLTTKLLKRIRDEMK